MPQRRKEKQKFSLGFIAFLQALGLLVYCIAVSMLIDNGSRLFGPVFSPIGPLLFLTLFVTSALICTLIVGAYPFILFWDKKKTKDAVKLVVYTAIWGVFFVAAILFFLFTNR